MNIKFYILIKNSKDYMLLKCLKNQRFLNSIKECWEYNKERNKVE